MDHDKNQANEGIIMLMFSPRGILHFVSSNSKGALKTCQGQYPQLLKATEVVQQYRELAKRGTEVPWPATTLAGFLRGMKEFEKNVPVTITSMELQLNHDEIAKLGSSNAFVQYILDNSYSKLRMWNEQNEKKEKKKNGHQPIPNLGSSGTPKEQNWCISSMLSELSICNLGFNLCKYLNRPVEGTFGREVNVLPHLTATEKLLFATESLYVQVPVTLVKKLRPMYTGNYELATAKEDEPRLIAFQSWLRIPDIDDIPSEIIERYWSLGYFFNPKLVGDQDSSTSDSTKEKTKGEKKKKKKEEGDKKKKKERESEKTESMSDLEGDELIALSLRHKDPILPRKVASPIKKSTFRRRESCLVVDLTDPDNSSIPVPVNEMNGKKTSVSPTSERDTSFDSDESGSDSFSDGESDSSCISSESDIDSSDETLGGFVVSSPSSDEGETDEEFSKPRERKRKRKRVAFDESEDETELSLPAIASSSYSINKLSDKERRKIEKKESREMEANLRRRRTREELPDRGRELMRKVSTFLDYDLITPAILARNFEKQTNALIGGLSRREQTDLYLADGCEDVEQLVIILDLQKKITQEMSSFRMAMKRKAEGDRSEEESRLYEAHLLKKLPAKKRRKKGD